MKIPKILVDGHILDGRPQGTTTYLAGLYRSIAEQNLAKITIATFYKGSLNKYNLSHPNINWVKLSSKNKYARLIFLLPYLEYKLKPDYTHYNYIAPIFKFSKRIVTCHDLLFLDFPQYFSPVYRNKNRILFNISLKNTDIISTVSKYSATSISNHFHIPFKKIMIAPNAISNYEASNSDENAAGIFTKIKNSKYFIYVSRFEPRKNQHSLVKAFNIFCDSRRDDFKLVLIGYPDLKYLELEKALDKSKEGRIIIFSDINQSELIWLYKNAIASIYPSYAEGFGIPPIEAIAAGGKSYCANNTALSELTDFVNGTFDPLNINEIVNILNKAVDDSNFCDNKILKNKVINNFNWKNSAKKFISSL